MEVILKRAEAKKEDVVCVLWGVGNHGGGPSGKDLADIRELMKESKEVLTEKHLTEETPMEKMQLEKPAFALFHSTPENFFARINPVQAHAKSLRTSMPGCYTSMRLMKSGYAQLKNHLYMVEKLCSAAALRGLLSYPEEEIKEAVQNLLNSEFHDVLPGSCIRAGEENGQLLIHHALLILNRLRARAYFAMTALEPAAKTGEYPILVLNSNPYVWETEVSCVLLPT